MSRRGLGFVLVLTFAIAAAAGVVQDFRFDAGITNEHFAAEKLNRSVETVQVTLANLRAAQAGYLAAGQGPEFWMKRTLDLSAEIENSLSSLLAAATVPDARAHYEAAISALGGLNSLDQKARDDLANGEQFLASDLVFTDGVETAQRVGNEVSAARDAERLASDARTADLRRWRVILNGGTVALLAVLALGLSLRRPAAPAVAATVADAPVSLGSPASPVADAATIAIVATATPTPAAASRPRLAEAAQVCVDLARVLDGRDVPPLLERAARVLDAKGLVLWVADGSGGLLRPSLAYGYADKVLQRLGALPVEADNVTSLAFRSMQAQVLRSPSGGASGAIAVPLITPTGCIGVLAAEVADTLDNGDQLALAQMFAAQLATFVTPLDIGAQRIAQG